MPVPPENEPQTGKSGNAVNQPPQQVTLRSSSLDNTLQLGALLGTLLVAGDLILLQGNLGAGKTAFTQGIGRGLSMPDTINSPTFTILKEYTGRLPLYHFDLYRIEEPDEFSALGFDDYFGDAGVCVVEWAERAEATAAAFDPWPTSYLRIHLRRISENIRSLICTAHGERGHALLHVYTHAIQASQAATIDEVA